MASLLLSQTILAYVFLHTVSSKVEELRRSEGSTAQNGSSMVESRPSWSPNSESVHRFSYVMRQEDTDYRVLGGMLQSRENLSQE